MSDYSTLCSPLHKYTTTSLNKAVLYLSEHRNCPLALRSSRHEEPFPGIFHIKLVSCFCLLLFLCVLSQPTSLSLCCHFPGSRLRCPENTEALETQCDQLSSTIVRLSSVPARLSRMLRNHSMQALSLKQALSPKPRDPKSCAPNSKTRTQFPMREK